MGSGKRIKKDWLRLRRKKKTKFNRRGPRGSLGDRSRVKQMCRCPIVVDNLGIAGGSRMIIISTNASNLPGWNVDTFQISYVFNSDPSILLTRMQQRSGKLGAGSTLDISALLHFIAHLPAWTKSHLWSNCWKRAAALLLQLLLQLLSLKGASAAAAAEGGGWE